MPPGDCRAPGFSHRRSPYARERFYEEERLHRLKVVDDDEDIIHSFQRHVLSSDACCAGGTDIIQAILKRSVSMPNCGDQNVFVSGISTVPPSARAANARFASASVGTFKASLKPLTFPSSGEQPSVRDLIARHGLAAHHAAVCERVGRGGIG